MHAAGELSTQRDDRVCVTARASILTPVEYVYQQIRIVTRVIIGPFEIETDRHEIVLDDRLLAVLQGDLVRLKRFARQGRERDGDAAGSLAASRTYQLTMMRRIFTKILSNENKQWTMYNRTSNVDE